MLSVKSDLTHAYQDVVGVVYKNEHFKNEGQPPVELFDMCFEIIKFKFLIDDRLKVWLLGLTQGPAWTTEPLHSTPLEREVYQ